MKNARDGLVNALLLQFERNYIASPPYPELMKQLTGVRRTITIRPTKDITSTYSLSGLDHVTALALAVKAIPLYSKGIFYVKTNKRPIDLNKAQSGVLKVY